AIRHVNEDHDDNRPENLRPAHYGCHSRHHKLLNPLVAKGSRLPDEWRERIAKASRTRIDEMTEEERVGWLSKVLAGMERVDKTPTSCRCGAGPFKGQQGLNIHRARGACT